MRVKADERILSAIYNDKQPPLLLLKVEKRKKTEDITDINSVHTEKLTHSHE